MGNEFIVAAGRKCFRGWKRNSAEKNNLSQALESGKDHLNPFKVHLRIEKVIFNPFQGHLKLEGII